MTDDYEPDTEKPEQLKEMPVPERLERAAKEAAANAPPRHLYADPDFSRPWYMNHAFGTGPHTSHLSTVEVEQIIATEMEQIENVLRIADWRLECGHLHGGGIGTVFLEVRMERDVDCTEHAEEALRRAFNQIDYAIADANAEAREAADERREEADDLPGMMAGKTDGPWTPDDADDFEEALEDAEVDAEQILEELETAAAADADEVEDAFLEDDEDDNSETLFSPEDNQ